MIYLEDRALEYLLDITLRQRSPCLTSFQGLLTPGALDDWQPDSLLEALAGYAESPVERTLLGVFATRIGRAQHTTSLASPTSHQVYHRSGATSPAVGAMNPYRGEGPERPSPGLFRRTPALRTPVAGGSQSALTQTCRRWLGRIPPITPSRSGRCSCISISIGGLSSRRAEGSARNDPALDPYPATAPTRAPPCSMFSSTQVCCV